MIKIEVNEAYKKGGFNPQTAPIEQVIKYLTVDLKKKWRIDEES